MDREYQALFALVRSGLWSRYDEAMASVFPLPADSWERVFMLARQQTVTGITFRGLDFLPEEMSPPMGLTAKWMAYADQVENSNHALNAVLSRLCAHFDAAGEKAVLQKGPGVAMMYPEPLLRECGDIDLYFPEANDGPDPLKGVPGAESSIKPDGSWEYVLDGVVVERHTYLLDILSPKARKYAERLIAEKGFEEVEAGGCKVLVPAPEINLLLLSSHILKHALGVGIGLRQICDFAVAKKYYADRINPVEMNEVWRRTGLRRWQKAFDGFIGRYLNPAGAQDDRNQLCTCDEKNIGSLLEIISKGGNFGRFTGNREMASKSLAMRKLHTLMSFVGNLRFALTCAPGEWFWTIIQLMRGQIR